VTVKNVKEVAIATKVFLKQTEETLKHEGHNVEEYTPLIRPIYGTTLNLRMYVLNDMALLHVEVPYIAFMDEYDGMKSIENFNNMKLELLTELQMEETENEETD
jgi:hypothetical protein